MGTASSKKFIKNAAGQLTEEAALTTSAGAGDANAIPALNASGFLDPTILNGTVASAGAGSAAKVVQLDGAGRIDSTVLPVGIGADTASIVASEALAAGDFVNIWNNAGTTNVRKADASTSGKDANGFVLSAVASSGTAIVYFEGTNTQVTGMVGGKVYLSVTVAGKAQAAAPTGTGQIVQNIGFATGATAINFQANPSVLLA